MEVISLLSSKVLSQKNVLEEIISSTPYTPYYSGDKSVYETDFLIQKKGAVISVEVKSEENTKSKSLRVYYDKFKPEYALRFSSLDYVDQEWMMNIPLWAVETI